jgi:hypothetical protein
MDFASYFQSASKEEQGQMLVQLNMYHTYKSSPNSLDELLTEYRFPKDMDSQLKWSMNQTITVTKRIMLKRNAIPILE